MPERETLTNRLGRRKLELIAGAIAIGLLIVFTYRVNWAEALHKFLDRRLDIVSTVLSAAISAAVVWLFADMFVKRKHEAELRLDRAKQSQRLELERRNIRDELLISRANWVATLKRELEQFKDTAEVCLGRAGRGARPDFNAPHEYARWLKATGLSTLPRNTPLEQEYIEDITSPITMNFDARGYFERYRSALDTTAFPDPQDESFPWPS